MVYSSIAPLYERWCKGDESYEDSKKFYVEMLKDKEGLLVELGIGTGRIGVELAQWYSKKLMGIDLCVEMLEICGEKVTKANLNERVQLLKQDFRNLKLPEPADCIYMPFRTIGHICDRDERRLFFAKVFSSLRKGGLFLFDHYQFNLSWAEQHDRMFRKMYQDSEILIEDYYIYDFNRHEMDCRVFCNRRLLERFPFSWIEPEEIKEDLEGAGFIIERVYGDFDGSLYSEDSPQQIWWALKEG